MVIKGIRVVVEEPGKDVFTHSKLQEYDIPQVKDGEVRIKMLAAPVNPSDVHCIIGLFGYPLSPPFTVGFEGVGEVEEIGAGVTTLSVGDWVFPGEGEFGTWRTHAVVPAEYVAKIDKSIGFKNCATLRINPSTAYTLLKDVIDLEPGDTFIQNGANSTVGLALIQFAKALGINTINVVRERKTEAENEALKKKLEDLGATVVITDKQLMSRKDEDSWPGDLTKPRLAIDCVGGENGSELVRHLPHGGTLVNYGLMSQKPLSVSPSDLIFRDIRVVGFFLPTALSKGSQDGSQRLATEIFPFIRDLHSKGQYRFPEYELFSIKDYKSALKHFLAGYSNKKQLIIMDDKLLK